VLEQEEHDDEPEVGVKLPLLLKPQADMSRSSLSRLQLGQDNLSSLPKTRASNSSLQFKHLYS
jgi:hypothetical protein